MPKKIERRLKRAAGKHKNWSQARKNSYVYGTLTKIKKRKARKRR